MLNKLRKLIANILKKQSLRIMNKTDAKVVVIAGSVGKTSTTQAIATVLGSELKIVSTIANYNTDVGVSCSIFGNKIPNILYNPFAWLKIFITNEYKILNPSHVDVFVLEIGTDKPGEILWFEWLKPDIAIVTAVAPEHMEFFESLDHVAKEELSVIEFSKKVIVNKSLVDKKYLEGKKVEYYSRKDLEDKGIKVKELSVFGDHSLDAVASAVVVGEELGLDLNTINKIALKIKPQPGRMQVLEGIKESTLIDDTYNASPEAVIAALDYLYSFNAPQKIALLGNMNELGNFSKKEHISIGEHCDPNQLDLVITLGIDANKYTALAARSQGCEVIETKHPYDAANIIQERLKNGCIVLLKGSQNGVFAEEATRKLLNNPNDESKLVRQSISWKEKKLKSLGRI